MTRAGKVFLIGAGPGDPELITLKAVRALAQCDVLFVDDLANPAVLEHARPGTRRIACGKRAGFRSTPQAFIERSMLRFARAGATVGRVKGGDPFVFGRGGEEMIALARAGIEVEVIPGITAGCAVPAALGIPVTHRDMARGVTFVTGHARSGAPLAYDALVRSGTTLVIYMGLAHLAEIAAGLIAAGMAPSTPACAISQGTLPGQRAVIATLERLPHQAQGIPAPALLVIGEVVSLAQSGEAGCESRRAA